MNTALLSLSIGWTLVAPPVEADSDPAATDAPVEVTPGNENAPPGGAEGREIADGTPTAVVAEPAAPAPKAKQDVPEPVVAPASVLEPQPASILEQDLVCDEEPPQIWDGFKIASRDGRHSLDFGFLGQLRTTVQDTATGDPSGGFSVRLARPTMVAQLWGGRVAMRLMPEFAGGTPSLLDATATVKANDAFAVQVGQFRPWISRGYRTGLPVVGLPGRGQIVDRFRIDRDVGLTVRGQPFGGKFEYYFGVLNGSGPGSRTLAPSPLLTGRVVVAPLGSVPYTQTPYVHDTGPRSKDRDAPPRNPMAVAVGAAAYTVANRENYVLDDGTTLRTDPRRKWGASGDIVVSRRRVFAMAEGFYEHRFGFENTPVPSEDAWGVYGQAGVLAWNPFLDVTFRSGLMSDFDRHFVPIEPGINVYFYGNHGKLQLSYRCDVDLQNHSHGCSTHVGTLQAQLLF